MKEREILDGDPSKKPHGDDEEHDQDEDDDELDDGDDGGPGPSGGKVSKKPLDDSEDIFDKDKDPEEMTPPGIDRRPTRTLEEGQSWRWEDIPQ